MEIQNTKSITNVRAVAASLAQEGATAQAEFLEIFFMEIFLKEGDFGYFSQLDSIVQQLSPLGVKRLRQLLAFAK